MERETAMKILKELHNKSLFAERTALETIIPELKESEDEKIRKALVRFHKSTIDIDGIKGADILAWIEKQCDVKFPEVPIEHGKYYYCIKDYYSGGNLRAKHGDVVQALRGMSMMILDSMEAGEYFLPVNKIIEEQGEQKPTNDTDEEIVNAVKDTSVLDMVEPKFKVGDWVVYECGEDSATLQIKNIVYGTYEFTDDSTLNVVDEDILRLWSIKDAKDGDVLYSPSHRLIWIYKDSKHYYACINLNCITNHVAINDSIIIPSDVCPADRVQKSILFQKMEEAGYEWDAEKKELKLLITNGGDFEPKQEWSEEDMSKVQRICKYLDEAKKYYADITEVRECVNWLKSLKDRVWHNSWKPSKEQMEALEYYMHTLLATEHKEVLFGLYNDLKKL